MKTFRGILKGYTVPGDRHRLLHERSDVRARQHSTSLATAYGASCDAGPYHVVIMMKVVGISLNA